MIAELVSRARFLFRRAPGAELEEELRMHLEQAVDGKIAAGLSPAEARRQAMLEFGSVSAAREQAHAQHPRMGLDVLRQDLRFAVRSLRRDGGFTSIAVFILALGIGANVAVFSLVNTLLLRPLPFRNPEQVVWLQPAKDGGGLSGSTYSSDAFDDVRDMNRSYSGVTGYYAFSSPNNVKLTGGAVTQPATSVGVVPNFLEVLGIIPELGRGFRAEDGDKGAAPVMMLSHAFWMTRFHGDRGVLNRPLSIDNKPVTVIGVLPQSFDFGATFFPGVRVDMLGAYSLEEGRMEGNIVTLMGRLRPGVTVQQATAEAATLFPQLYWGKRDPASKGSYGRAVAVPMQEHVAGKLRRSLYMLWSAVAMILLIVCVNLSNLLLARAASRGKEFSLRFALGGSRGRLVRQLITESCVLSLLGSVLGVGFAWAVIAWLAHQGSIALPLMSELRLDVPTLVWTVLLALLTTLLFGVVPSLRITSGNDLQAMLKDGGAGAGQGRRHETMRNLLVVSEVALACVLIVGAGLLLRSFLRVLEVDPGYQPAHAAAIATEPPDLPVAQRGAYYRNLLHEVSAIPGVEAAGISDNLPLARNRTWGPPGIKGVNYGRNERPPTFVYIVTPGYFAAMGMRLSGRDFGWQDGEKTEPVMVLNERAAKFLFPKEDALNHMVSMNGKDVRIVGVVPDIHETDLEVGSAWQVYLPMTQGWGENGAEVVVRSSLPAATLAPSLMSALRRMDPGQAALELRPLTDFVDHATSPRRFFAVLVVLFAGTGLLLACLGIYGVISYAVTRQTQEIGIRMALGATRGSVLRSVVQRTLRLAGSGIAVGTLASVVLARTISSLLYGTELTDPATFAVMLAVLLTVAVAAGYLPARRASRISPMEALRAQ